MLGRPCHPPGPTSPRRWSWPPQARRALGTQIQGRSCAAMPTDMRSTQVSQAAHTASKRELCTADSSTCLSGSARKSAGESGGMGYHRQAYDNLKRTVPPEPCARLAGSVRQRPWIHPRRGRTEERHTQQKPFLSRGRHAALVCAALSPAPTEAADLLHKPRTSQRASRSSSLAVVPPSSNHEGQG